MSSVSASQPSQTIASSPRASAAATRRPVVTARFIVCIGLLGGFALGMMLYSQKFGGYFQKRPLPLKISLAAFNFDALGPRFALPAEQPPPLSHDVEESLGTKDYFQARLIDRTKDTPTSRREVHLFVTYYTGKPDQVPHVPDECMIAANMEKIGEEDREVTIPAAGSNGQALKTHFRILRFRPKIRAGGGGERTVLYFFNTNGRYAITRDEVRLAQFDFRQRYAYYAKIEVNVTDVTIQQIAGQTRESYRDAGIEDVVATTIPLMERFLPVFLRDHIAWEDASTGPNTAPQNGPR